MMRWGPMRGTNWGLPRMSTAQPLVAAVASALFFAVGAALPLGAAMLAPEVWLIWAVTGLSLVFLAVLGGAGRLGGRGAAGAGRAARDLLGGDRHGRDGGRRQDLRRGGVRAQSKRAGPATGP